MPENGEGGLVDFAPLFEFREANRCVGLLYFWAAFRPKDECMRRVKRREFLSLGLPLAARAQWVAEVQCHLASEDVPLLLVEAQVNGEVLRRLVLDTGNVAAPLVLSRAGARAAAVAIDEGRQLRGASGIGGGVAMFGAEVARFEFAGMVQAGLAAAVSPGLDRLSESTGVRIDGALGGEYFRGLALRLDYERRSLTLTRGGTAAAWHSFACPAGKALPLVEVELNGQGPFRFALDTGASYCAIARDLVRELKLGRGIDAQVAGVGGVEAGFFTKVRRVAAGGGSWGNLTMASGGFFAAMQGKFGVRVDGVLGANALARRVLTIDYSGRRWGIEGV